MRRDLTAYLQQTIHRANAQPTCDTEQLDNEIQRMELDLVPGRK